MPNIGAPELIIILLIVVLLFGAKRLPDTARGLGRSLRIFKAETRGLGEDESSPAQAASAEPGPPAVTGGPAPAPAQDGAQPGAAAAAEPDPAKPHQQR